MGTPSTADLLRAAQSGSTAQLHMDASQFGTSTAPFAPPGKYTLILRAATSRFAELAKLLLGTGQHF